MQGTVPSREQNEITMQKISCSLAPLNKSGFFEGRYYGVNYLNGSGEPMRLYAIYTAAGDLDMCVRAISRREAIAAYLASAKRFYAETGHMRAAMA